MELYPLKMEPIFRRKVWGGRNLEKVLNKKLPGKYKIGESLEVFDIKNDSTRVSNGVLKDKPLSWLIKEYAREILGDEVFGRLPRKRLPLAFKYIDVNEPLSIQVHPPDVYAELYDPTEAGKVEAWYVVHAGRDARVMRGLIPGVDRKKFISMLMAGKVYECVHTFKVEAGDVIFIPPGTVHSASGGVVLAEIQQASDSTYRIYDWGRTSEDEERTLSIERALDVIDFSIMGQHKYVPGLIRKKRNLAQYLLMKCDKFSAELWVGHGQFGDRIDFDSFQIVSVLDGRLHIRWGVRGLEVTLTKGQTVLIPACLEHVEFMSRAKAKFLRFY